jgi:hypothetical protein
MTLSLAIIINVLADLGLVGGLAYAMSHASRLSPHDAATGTPATEPTRATPRRPVRLVQRASSAPATVAS